MPRSRMISIAAFLALVFASGCRAPEDAVLHSLEVAKEAPRIEQTQASTLTAKGGRVEELTSVSERGWYEVTLPMAEAWNDGRFRGKLPEEAKAYLVLPSGRLRVFADSRPTLTKPTVSVQFSRLPPGCETVGLDLEIGGETAHYRLSGLHVGEALPRLPAREVTPVGVVEAYGLFSPPNASHPNRFYGGMALRLPATPGFVKYVIGLQIAPAYSPWPDGGNRGDGFSGASLRLPAEISSEGYAYDRWQAKGILELYAITGMGRASDPDSPVAVTMTSPGKQWRVSERGTLPDGERIEAKIAGVWQPVDARTDLSENPGDPPYRRLTLTRAAPFAVQSKLLNEVRTRIPGDPDRGGILLFDYGNDLDARAGRGEDGGLDTEAERE